MLDEDLLPDYRYIYYLLSQNGENLYKSYRTGGIAAFCETLANFPSRYFETTASFSHGRLTGAKIRSVILAYKRYTPFEFTTYDKVYMAAYNL